ncbi:LpxI family protein [Mucisphaera sp.]|uniref:LpxI family protein n=1 Tax=Mucisphaera sp. TaxID=2913024 RepID=UPI003D09E4A5
MEDPPIGLLAGGGRLPIIEAQGIRAAGRKVACVGFTGQYDKDLPDYCDHFETAGIVRLNRWLKLMHRWNVQQAIMVGYVRKTRMYQPLRIVSNLPDSRAIRLWYRVLRNDKRSQQMLGAIADDLRQDGVELIDTTAFIKDHLAELGVMTKTQPSSEQQLDIEFASPILARMNDLDIGQAIAIKERDVIAVEAIEGTDKMIKRAGELCRAGGWTLIKGAKPSKDLRFDVPTIGLSTIENLKAAKASCLVLTAHNVIMIDKQDVIDAADAANIVIVGIEPVEDSGLPIETLAKYAIPAEPLPDIPEELTPTAEVQAEVAESESTDTPQTADADTSAQK